LGDKARGSSANGARWLSSQSKDATGWLSDKTSQAVQSNAVQRVRQAKVTKTTLEKVAAAKNTVIESRPVRKIMESKLVRRSKEKLSELAK